jgi:hypothetical protein
MELGAGDRVHLVIDKVFAQDVTVVAGTCGTIQGVQVLYGAYTVLLDGDNFPRMILAIDLAGGCP